MRIQATTGLAGHQFEELVEMVVAVLPTPAGGGRPPRLDTAARVQLTLEHLRTNAAQQVLAEHYGISPPTVCRVIKAMLPVIDQVLSPYQLGVEDLATADRALLVDGTIIPTGRRAGQDRLYNGKHKTHGVNIQVISNLVGEPLWASPPRPGADHDLTCFTEHGLSALFNRSTGIADAGYQGHNTTGLITPVKRRISHDLTTDRTRFNRDLAAIRALIERLNAWLKNWKILSTRYRRTWNDLELTIRTTFHILRYRQLTYE